MADESLPESWAYQILENEDSWDRFEDFAIAVASVLEGRSIVRTSKTWDRGRDGRSAAPGQDVFVLASLRKDLKKPSEDATRLKATTPRIRRVYIYLSHALTEDYLDEATRTVREILGEVPEIDSYGAHQLVGLVTAGKVDKQFKELYASDIVSLRFAHNPPQDTPQLNHLWLALATFEAKDVQGIRQELLESTILGLLSSGAASIPELIVLATQKFGCPLFSEPACKTSAISLVAKTEIESLGFRFGITKKGSDRLAALSASTNVGELKAGHAVRASIEKSLGHGLPEQQWSRLWLALQRELADVLYTRGQQFVETMSRLAVSSIDSVARDSFADLLERAIKKAVSDSTAAVQIDKVTQAVQDAFIPGSPGDAFELLSDLSAKFVALCTLGITSEVAVAIENVLATMQFAVDTDVVVSWYCGHEAGYDAARTLTDVSRRLHKRLMVPHAVAEETARHAVKAHTVNYEQVGPRREKKPLQWFEIEELQSAFAREFEYMRCEGKVESSQWKRYIEQYTGPLQISRGKLVPDIAKMRSLLNTDGFLVLSPVAEIDRTTVERLSTQISEEKGKRQTKREHTRSGSVDADKARIDAELLVSVSSAMRSSQDAGKPDRFVLVSSAGSLRKLPAESKALLGLVPEVLTLTEAALLLSLLPNRVVSLKALRVLLFEGDFHASLAPLFQSVRLVLRNAASIQMPGATRGLVVEAFRDQLLDAARASGKPVAEVKRAVRRDPTLFAQYAAAAADALALQDHLDRQQVLERVKELARKDGMGDSADVGQTDDEE